MSRDDPRRSEPPPLPAPLAVPVADSHCHLDIDRAGGDRPLEVDPRALGAVADRAAGVGVRRIVQVGCDRPGARWAVRAADAHDALIAGVALHPNEVPVLAARGELEEALDEIDRLAASSDRVRVIGETGLDHFRTTEEGWALQEQGLRAHIDLAVRRGLALQIHDRDAHADLLRVLADAPAPERVILHCFSGDVEMARECVRRGYVLSFAGTVTFKNAGGLRDALAAVPLDQLLVETDAPYLTPVPYRGRPNASYLIPLTVRRMAEVKGVAEEELCAALDATTTRVFGTW